MRIQERAGERSGHVVANHRNRCVHMSHRDNDAEHRSRRSRCRARRIELARGEVVLVAEGVDPPVEKLLEIIPEEAPLTRCWSASVR